MTRLLATVIRLWLFRIGRAVDWTFGTIMPKGGGWLFRLSRVS